MLFHPDKCKWSVLRVTTKQNPIKFDYTLYQHVLQKETSTKYVVGFLYFVLFCTYTRVLCLMDSPKSFIYTRNRIGPKAVPWGTSDVMWIFLIVQYSWQHTLINAWSVLRVTTKQNPIKFSYSLYQHVLQKETSTKYVVGTVNTTFFCTLHMVHV
jgi:hypothetical protein